MAEIVDFGLQQHKIKMDSRYFENVLSVVAGDTGRRIEVQLLDTNGMVQNTTGLNLRLNALIAGKATFTDATLVDAATGKYQLDLSNGMFLAPGNWEFQWQITDSSGKKLNSFAFTGNVGKNITEGGVEATNFYLNIDSLKAMQDDLVNGTFNSEALETNIAEKLEALEETYAPRLTEVTAQLAQTETELIAKLAQNEQNLSQKVGGGKLATMSDMGQDVKTAMTGGSVAVVGTDTIIEDNIVDSQVTERKLSETIRKRLVINATNRFNKSISELTVTGGAGTVAGNVMTIIGNGTTQEIQAGAMMGAKDPTHKYYSSADVLTETNAFNGLRIYPGGVYTYYKNAVPGTWHKVSSISSNTNFHSVLAGAYFADKADANGKIVKLKNFLEIDLTASFGFGNEPSKEEMDYLMSQFPEAYFAGTENLISTKRNNEDLYDLNVSDKERISSGILSGAEIKPAFGMSVSVSSGIIYNTENKKISISETTLSIEPSGASYRRRDVVYADHLGKIGVLKGKEVEWLEVPQLDSKSVKLAEIHVRANVTEIKEEDIILHYSPSDTRKLSSKLSTIMVAASNSSEYDKSIADYVCDGINDEVQIQKAVDHFIFKSGTVRLANGDYYIDSLYDTGSGFAGKFGIVIKRPDLQREVVIEGSNAPIRKLNHSNVLSGTNSPVLHLNKTLYDSLSVDELVTIVGVLPGNLDTGAIYYPAISFNVYKLGIQIPDNKKTIRCIDLYYASMGKTEDVLIMSMVHTGQNIKTEGIRGLRGHNFGTGYSMKNMFMWGMGIGYNISGEHLIMENCGVRYSLYPFAFGMTPDQQLNGHPITLINCTHESCVNGPIFGDNPNKQFITFIDYNMEHGGMVQGAKELVPGAFTGSINYGIVGYPGQHDYINVDYPFWELGSGINFKTVNVAHKFSGTTAERPVHPNLNQQYYDTTLNKMVFYIENAWKDAMGTSV